MRKTFVHKIPMTHEARGYRADDWGIEKPLMTAVLKVTSKNEELNVKLFTTGSSGLEELLAVCPIVLDPDTTKKASAIDHFVEPVRDSSRYFVILVKVRDMIFDAVSKSRVLLWRGLFALTRLVCSTLAFSHTRSRLGTWVRESCPTRHRFCWSTRGI